MPAAVEIRVADEADLEQMRVIEREAGDLFRTIGMDAVADDELPTIDELRPYVEDRRAWVAVDATDTAIGYLVADVVDGHGHVEQVSVLPSWSRLGIGRALIDRALEWAARQGFAAVTLTTFTRVAWNGPYYERLGFHYLDRSEVGPELAAIRADERRKGLDTWPRAAMSTTL